MFESFVTALIIYVVVIIDPIGNATIFLAVTGAQHGTRKLCTALEATTIMLFFAPYRALDPRLSRHHRGRLQDCRRHNLFIVALDMLAAKRQQRKRVKITSDGNAGETVADESDGDNLAIYPLAIPLLAGPSAIMSVIVVNGAGLPGR